MWDLLELTPADEAACDRCNRQGRSLRIFRDEADENSLILCDRHYAICGTCEKSFPDIYPAARCPYEYDHAVGPGAADAEPYARCSAPGCSEMFSDREKADQHSQDTMTETAIDSEDRKHGVTAKGHTFTVTNPPPEELESNRISGMVFDRVEDALSEAMERLAEDVQRRRLTTEQVTKELRGYPDFADAWDEVLSELED